VRDALRALQDRGAQAGQHQASDLPLADGRFQVSVALSRLDSTLQFHRLDPAIEFTVFPDEDQPGWFRFEGDWALAASPNALEPL